MSTPSQINVTESHKDLSDGLTHLESGRPVILCRNGKEVAAIVSLEDLRLLEQLIEEKEDQLDIAEAEQILAETKEEDWIPFEHIKVGL